MALIARHVSARLLAQARLEYVALAFHGQQRCASNDASGDQTSSSSLVLPQWVKSRLPAALGGERETLNELESLTMEKYLGQISAARFVVPSVCPPLWYDAGSHWTFSPSPP